MNLQNGLRLTQFRRVHAHFGIIAESGKRLNTHAAVFIDYLWHIIVCSRPSLK
jgi:hypothetical protein